MSQGASHYPIVQFIFRLMQEHGFSRFEFVRALGYRNIDRGLRRLEPWLNQGEGYDRILNQIATAYPNHADGLEKAVAATRAIKTAEAEAAFLERCKTEEATFVPFVHAQGESRIPSGICIFGITGGHQRWTTIEIPKAILDLPLDDQLAAVPELMRAYERRYNGAVPFFGKLTGFKFVRLLDHFQSDKHGQFIEHVEKPFRRGTCFVQLR
jgi:hypothetical protein